MLKRLCRERALHLMLLPSIVLLFLFHYIPLGGIVIAFQDYSPVRGILRSDWVGLGNFTYIFSLPTFPRVLRNTLLIACGKVVLNILVPVTFALLLNEIRSAVFKRTIQTVAYLPHFLSAVVVCSITYQLFSVEDGVINHILNALGFESVNVLMNEAAYRSLFVGLEIWQGTGWGTIIYLAALSSVDVQMYEASMLEGANRWQQMWYITLPSILPIVMVTLVLRMGDLLDVGLEKTLLLSNAMNRQVAEVFDSYVYQRGVVDGRYSFSAAVGLFKSAVGLILVLGSNYLSKKVTDETIY